LNPSGVPVENPVPWAIVGSGGIAARVATAFGRASVSAPVVIVSRAQSDGERFAAQHHIQRVIPSFAELLSDPGVSAVYLATPNALHAEQTIALCSAGKHVLCEKPMALSIDDCEAMAAAARANGVKLGVGFNFRFNPAHRDIRRLISEQSIGDLYSVHLRWGLPHDRSGWRLDSSLSGGGVLTDMGVHLLDLLAYLLDREVVSVAALATSGSWGPALDEVVTALLEFEGGVHAELAVSSRFAYLPNTFEAYGSAGTLQAPETLTAQMTEGIATIGHLELRGPGEISASQTDFAAVDLFAHQLDSFSRAILDDREPEAGAADGIRAQKLVLAIQESAKNRTRVLIS
jgi:1,5-anhydro-D-fructose reductase (1,5-anhydro-D-mannitol-forming)